MCLVLRTMPDRTVMMIHKLSDHVDYLSSLVLSFFLYKVGVMALPEQDRSIDRSICLSIHPAHDSAVFGIS